MLRACYTNIYTVYFVLNKWKRKWFISFFNASISNPFHRKAGNVCPSSNWVWKIILNSILYLLSHVLNFHKLNTFYRCTKWIQNHLSHSIRFNNTYVSSVCNSSAFPNWRVYCWSCEICIAKDAHALISQPCQSNPSGSGSCSVHCNVRPLCAVYSVHVQYIPLCNSLHLVIQCLIKTFHFVSIYLCVKKSLSG